MSQERLSRRRFLADLLFLAGGLTAAAFLGKSRPEPSPPLTDEDLGYPVRSSYWGGMER